MLARFKKEWDQLRSFLQIIRRTLAYAFRHSPIVNALFLVNVLLLAVVPFLSYWFLYRLIDELIRQGENSAPLFVVYLVTLIANKLLHKFADYLSIAQDLDMNQAIHVQMAEKFSRLDLGYYEDPQYNQLIQAVKANYIWRPAEFLNLIFILARDTLSLLISLIILGLFAPWLILIALVTLVPELINLVKFGRGRMVMWDNDPAERENYWLTLDYLRSERAIPEISIFGSREYLVNIVRRFFTGFREGEKHVERRRIRNSLFLSLLYGTGIATASWLLFVGVRSQAITLGLFVFLIIVIKHLSDYFSTLLKTFYGVYNHSFFVADIFLVMDLEPQVKNGTGQLATTGTPAVEFRDVWFKYPNSSQFVFKGLNFRIEAGEHVAVVGKNGAGKSTFVKLLCRFYDVTRGEILIDGVNIKALDLGSWYQKLALLSQEFLKYHFDVKTNIGLGNINRMNGLEKIRQAARMGEAHAFIENGFADGYDQMLSKKFPGGTEPSVGQWQKIALSRAFYRDAPIMILDEPTSAIDPEAEFEIFDRLFRLYQERSVIIISHRFSTVRNASRIIVLDDGEIVEEGSHESLMALNGRYARAFTLQRRGYE